MSTTPLWRPVPLLPGQAAIRPGRQTWRWLAAGFLVLLTTVALLAPVISGFDPLTVDYPRASLPPGPGGLLGTDPAGRSVALLTASGLRISGTVALAAAVLASVVGAVAGVTAVVVGGWVDQLLMRMVDAVNTIPHLLLGIVLVVFFRGSLVAMVLAIALTHWTQVARIVRAVALPLRDAEHLRIAAVLGLLRRDLVRWHLVPAILPQAAIGCALLVPHAVWHEATLSFLGVGLAPHQPSLGVLLNTGQQAVFTGAWWQVAVPALALVSVTLAITVLLRGRRTAGRP
ncbi:MAG TPA: ABC transporter permease [Candidatus Avipropionibacterium avicola]|uniref:ABC transporter permease n=1 Tax=Candidatus Avipropionibacterium avicola TaxID=2840701 RepID=A0A9D1GVI7_9ACTN|nr:ABC transporter permease [Candidatus Avipropionibacterium avicola]